MPTARTDLFIHHTPPFHFLIYIYIYILLQLLLILVTEALGEK